MDFAFESFFPFENGEFMEKMIFLDEANKEGICWDKVQKEDISWV